MPRPNYHCVLCETLVLPGQRFSTIGAIGHKDFFGTFACFSETRFAHLGCVNAIFPYLPTQRKIDFRDCAVCSKVATKIGQQAELSVPSGFQDLSEGCEQITGCYSCVARHVADYIESRMVASTDRVGCPKCRRPKGRKTLVVSDITLCRNKPFTRLDVSCKTCFTNEFGFFPSC